MKRSFLSSLVLLFTVTTLLNSCSKDKTPGGGNGPTLNIMYPVKQIFSESGNGNYPFERTYEYNADNRLVKYGQEGNWIREVGTNGVNAITWNGDEMMMLSYAFRMYINPNQAISIFEGPPPTEVSIDRFTKNLTSGVTSSSHYNTFQFTNFADNYLQSELAFGRNYNYSYDDDKNLKEINYVENGKVYSRVRVISLDKNPSPFFAVKGYRYASYPQVYVPEIVSAYCFNNPIRVVVEDVDPVTNAWKLYEENDFTYEYNELGYPTTVQLSITYHTATVSHFTKTYKYTYRK